MEERLKYADLAPDGIAAMRGVEHYLNAASGLPPGLLELVRLRSSLLNRCGFCIGLHSAEMRKRHEPEDRIGGVAEWRNSDLYTPPERAAMAWAEAITNIQEGQAPDELYEEMVRHFTPKEVVDLTIAIASINAWNRLGISFRLEWQPKEKVKLAVQPSK